jgi:hypothetical protein
MNGLVVVPNHQFKAENAIDEVAKKHGLRAGRTELSLDDVHAYNSYAKYHADGTTP